VDFAELQRRVDARVKVDLQPLYAAYQSQGGSGDIHGFIAYLGTARVIDASLLKELHAAGQVELPRFDDPALRGTQLAAWSQAATRPGIENATSVGAATAGAATATGAGAATGAGLSRPPGADVRYTTVTWLAQGAMGAVSIARDTYLRRMVALKTVLPEMAAHPQLLGRFLTEMQITAQIEHPNIVPIYALEIAPDGTLGYAMKLVQGRDFGQLIDEARAQVEKGEPLDEDHALEKRLDCFLKVCDALDVAHQKGIVHRDLKPANIMIGRHNDVYLMDWGIARPMGEGGQALEAGIELREADGTRVADLSRTQIGSAVGTPSYMSPEQAAGRNAELDGRSDQYAMGLILQEAVSLHDAVAGATVEEILTKAREARRDPVRLGDRPGYLPREIDAIVRRATQLRPEDRYPSVRALADEVRRYLRNEALQALPDGPVRRASRWVSKHRGASLALILSLALAGAGATIGSLALGQSRVAALHARELRTSELETESAIQAQLVEHELGRYEVALSKFVGAAQRVIEDGAADAPSLGPYSDAQFRLAGAGPADLQPSKRYGKPASVIHAVFAPPPGAAEEPPDPRLRPLGTLGPAFRELLIDSAGGTTRPLTLDQQRAAILDVGVPALRAVVVFADGLTLAFPGAAGAAGEPGADRRADPLYQLAAVKPGASWGTPALRDGQMVLPLATAIHDASALQGVAILEVSVDRLLAQPGSSKLDYVLRKLLVTRGGQVMAEENGPGGRVPLDPRVLEAIALGKSGSLETTSDGRTLLTTFYPLASLDWYFVAIADVPRMLASEEKIATSDPRKVIAAARAAQTPPAAPRATAAARVAPDAPHAGVTEPADAGADGGPTRRRVPGPLPVAAPSTSAPPPLRNPFDKWKEYDKAHRP
jgi:eukaryotic-like serine/threonine-protein kinase